MASTLQLGAQAVSRAFGVRDHGMPQRKVVAQGLIATHIAKKALGSLLHGGGLTNAARLALADAIFLDIARRHFGANQMIRGAHGFYPYIFMPDYHGPHFTEALQRIALPQRGPNILYLSLTGACPCQCEYCFAAAGGAHSPDLGDAKLEEVAASIARLHVPLVNISGGEPLARYDRLLRVVRTLGQGSEVRMFTCGIGLTRARLEELRQAGLRGVFVSLDTDDEALFDRARRKTGAFAAAIAALTTCCEAGMLTFVNCVVGRDRFTHPEAVEKFLEFIDDIDPRVVVNFLPKLSTGRGANAGGFRHPAECAALAELISTTAASLGRPVSMLFGAVDRYVGCPGAGGKLLNVDVWGNVTVCISRAGLGNITREPFADIYARYVAQCRRLKVGFFCAEVSRTAGDGLLAADASTAALAQFYDAMPDAEWQQLLDRYGWLIERLLPETGPREQPRAATRPKPTPAG